MGRGLDHPVDFGGGGQRSQHRGEGDRRRFFTGEQMVGRIVAYDEVALGSGELNVGPPWKPRSPNVWRV